MRISIEYGHSYFRSAPYVKSLSEGANGSLSRSLDADEMFMRDAASLLYSRLEDQGQDVSSVVFLDDVVMAYERRRSADGWRYAAPYERVIQGIKRAFSPDELKLESGFVTSALDLVERLGIKAAESGMQVNGNRIKLPTQRNTVAKVSLRRFQGIDDITVPSCDVLDLAFQLDRTRRADILITILPKSYRHQQERVDALARFLDDETLNKTSRVTLFLNDDGRSFDVQVFNAASAEAQQVFDHIGTLLEGRVPSLG